LCVLAESTELRAVFGMPNDADSALALAQLEQEIAE